MGLVSRFTNHESRFTNHASPGQRIRPHLEPHHLRPVVLAALAVEHRAVGARGPHRAPFPAGARLIDQCTDFARSAGYTRIRLWTNSVLSAARHLYQRAGYRLVASEPHHSFGHDLVGEIWELEL